MGGGKGKRDADEAPQQNHAKPGSVSRKLAKGGLNECSHNCSPLRSAVATHLFQTSPAILAIEQIKDC